MEGLSAIADPRVRGLLGLYLHCLLRWSPKINLTGAGSPDAVFETLISPVIGAQDLLVGPVTDVGSGNGSPGLILAALRPDVQFTLLEPRSKRWAFLREAAREMQIENVTVVRERSDTYRGPRAQTVTMRAVGLSPESLRPLLLEGGCVLVFGGPLLDGCERYRLSGGAQVQRRCFT